MAPIPRDPTPEWEARTLNRALLTGIIVFVGAAFIVAALSGGRGWIFLTSVGLAATLLIAAVLVLAFSGDARRRPDSPDIDFSSFERAASLIRGNGLPYGAAVPGARGPGPAGMGRDAVRASARVFVTTLVPAPQPPAAPEDAAGRREFLDALRKEGTGLIRLAKVMGVDVSPYQELLADTRGEAVRGEWRGTLRSLQLANELLRATIEKFLVNRRESGEDASDLEDA